VLWIGAARLGAEVEVYARKDVPLAVPLRLPIPAAAVPPSAIADGRLELHFSVDNPRCGWTMFPKDGLALSDGETRYPALPHPMPNEYNYGRIAPGEVFTLAFPLPPGYDGGKPLELVLDGGIVSWETPEGTFDLTVWQGVRMELAAHVDRANRTFRLTASLSAPPDTVESFRWEIPGSAPVVTKTDTWKQRLVSADPFVATVTAALKDGETLTASVPVTPQEKSVEAPLSDGEVLVGVCFYSAVPDSEKAPEELEKKVSWEAPRLVEPHSGSYYVEEFLKDGIGNLAVFWPGAPDLPLPDELGLIGKLAEHGIYTMTIYQFRDRETVEKLTAAGKNHYFLNNNIGEYAGYLYQPISSADACGIPQRGDLRACRDHFTDRFVGEGTRRWHDRYEFIFSTSGSTLANYELEGGIDFISGELYAVGAQNLAYSTGEMRGAARKWKPEFWAGWLAEEWQTFPVPYQSDQKYLLLRAGLYQQYLMGTSIIVLESGSQTTQAGYYTAESGKRNFAYDEDPPRRYRETMKEFYDFVKREGRRASGTPETRIAVALGNCDSYVGVFIDWFVAWAQYDTAEQDPNWKYGDPERSNQAAQQVFFPLAKDALSPYPNYWLAGSPYGQVDVVGIDDLTVPDDLARYDFLAFSGWNSMTPQILTLLDDYVRSGGTLFLALPQLSTRFDRNYTGYTVADLIGGGDLRPLIDLEVTGFDALSGAVEGPDAAGAALSGEPVAAVTAGDGVETVDSVGGKPLLVRQRRGEGEVFLLLGHGYPGKPSLVPVYRAVLARLAAGFRGDGWLEAPKDTLDSLSYAVYGDRMYLLNLDCVGSRSFTLHLDGQSEAVTLGPAEFRAVGRKGAK